jgi:hypothetical protein
MKHPWVRRRRTFVTVGTLLAIASAPVDATANDDPCRMLMDAAQKARATGDLLGARDRLLACKEMSTCSEYAQRECLTRAAEIAAAACTSLMDVAQQARAAGKLLSARKHLLTCTETPACPEEAARECATRAAEILTAMPTIVVEAHDRAGELLTDVTVTIDGEVVASELDGKALAVDPGSHALVVQRKDERSAQTFVAQERVKAYPIRVVFRGDGYEGPLRDVRGHTVWPWAVVGIGGAVVLTGVALVLTSPKMPPGCDADTRECTPLPGETAQAQSFDQRRREAGQAATLPAVGIGVAAGGAAIIGAGLLWHFLEPVEPRFGRTRLAPWLAQGSGGLAASGRF